jgi:hypothetical protein
VTEQGGGNELRQRWLGGKDDEMEDTRHRGLRDRITNINAPPPGPFSMTRRQIRGPNSRRYQKFEVRSFKVKEIRGASFPKSETRYAMSSTFMSYPLLARTQSI